jgi:SAM-dependent methyltransferase
MSFEQLAARMRRDWDARARENGKYYIANSNTAGSGDEFYALGRQTVRDDILTDMFNICQGRDPAGMKVLEIGCGVGRVTRALSGLFGSVDAGDLIPEMVALATKACAAIPNVRIFNNNGVILRHPRLGLLRLRLFHLLLPPHPLARPHRELRSRGRTAPPPRQSV